MNWLDLLIVGVIAFTAWRAYTTGFIRELVALLSVILAIPVAGLLYSRMFPKVHPIVDNEDFAAVLSFVSIMAGVIIGGHVIAHLLKRVAEMLNLGALDRLTGGLFGFLKAALIIQALLLVLIRYPSPDLRATIESSRAADALLDAAPVTLAFLPRTFETGLDLFREATDALDGEPSNQQTP